MFVLFPCGFIAILEYPQVEPEPIVYHCYLIAILEDVPPLKSAMDLLRFRMQALCGFFAEMHKCCISLTRVTKDVLYFIFMWKVALIYDATHAHDLKVMTGVAEYLHESGNYNVYIERNTLKDQRLPSLRSWDGDGIIANFDHPTVARAVTYSRLPAVAFGGGHGWYVRGSSIPYFSTNHTMVASMAADHLLTRRLRHFGYCGYVRDAINGWSEEREKAFVQYLRKQGFPCHVYRPHHKTVQRWTSLQRALGKWLTYLPKPVGVMAADDDRAHHVLEACRTVGLRVPEDVAVIGVNNDELLCKLTSPSLSSVEKGAKQMGYEAAALLERLMRGKKLRQRRFVFNPMGIVTRQSTDILAVDDPIVAKAMRFIFGHAVEGIKVPNVVAEVAISRTGLETRFIKSMGRTLHTAIRQVQLDRARLLILSTNLPLKQITAKAGFRSPQHMATLFRKVFHQSPGSYRKAVTLS
jgi:LacI family transcriptional regulator